MIQLVDQSIERFLRAVVPLPPSVALSFATPDKRWGAAITGPTVNLFLWDVRRDTRTAQIGLDHRTDGNGRTTIHQPDPDVAFRYLVTAWAGEPRDEHQLLGAVLRSSLAHGQIPPEHVQPELQVAGAVLLEVAANEGRPNDFWSSLDGQLKPGLEIVVRARIPLDPEIQLGAPISEIGLGVSTKAPTRPDDADVPTADGDGDGEPRTVRRERRRRGRVVTTRAVERPPGES